MKENKIRKTHTLDKKVYAEFQMYANCLGRSVSSLIEQFMRETLKEMKNEKNICFKIKKRENWRN